LLIIVALYQNFTALSDSSAVSQYGGCFPGDALVPIPGGEVKKMNELLPGDAVWSMDESGKVVRDEILTFMDIQRDNINGTKMNRMFVSIKTESGKAIKMTQNHLIFKQPSIFGVKNNFTNVNEQHEISIASFATKIVPGETIIYLDLMQPSSATLRSVTVTEVEIVTSDSGAFAPLTKHGTIVVDSVVASCYAVIESHKVAHAAMAPIRYSYLTKSWLSSWVQFPYVFSSSAASTNAKNESEPCDEEGVLFYARVLYNIGSKIIPNDLYWGD